MFQNSCGWACESDTVGLGRPASKEFQLALLSEKERVLEEMLKSLRQFKEALKSQKSDEQ